MQLLKWVDGTSICLQEVKCNENSGRKMELGLCLKQECLSSIYLQPNGINLRYIQSEVVAKILFPYKVSLLSQFIFNKFSIKLFLCTFFGKEVIIEVLPCIFIVIILFHAVLKWEIFYSLKFNVDENL